MKTHVAGVGAGVSVLLLLSAANSDVFQVSISMLLVVLPLINFLVMVMLWLASRLAPDVISLRNRFEDSVVLCFASSVGALLGVNRLLNLAIPGPVILGLLAAALVAISVPAISWLIVFRGYVRAALEFGLQQLLDRVSKED